MSGWNPRFVAYAKAHGMAPDAMLAHDRDAWPGGCMTGFIVWMGEKLTAFRSAHPEALLHGRISDQDAWDNFLEVE